MGNLNSRGKQSYYVTSNGPSNAVVNKFDVSSNPNVLEARSKTRPSTEVGRHRSRRATEPMAGVASTANVTGDYPDLTTNNSVSPSKNATMKAQSSFRIATSSHTPRFSMKNQTASSLISLERSVQTTPGPACYETRIESCVKQP